MYMCVWYERTFISQNCSKLFYFILFLFTSPLTICTPCKHELDTGSLTDMLTAKMQFLFLSTHFFSDTVQSSALDKLFNRELRADIHVK